MYEDYGNLKYKNWTEIYQSGHKLKANNVRLNDIPDNVLSKAARLKDERTFSNLLWHSNDIYYNLSYWNCM